jgi:alpha-D-xyloside xylohydrolase
MRDLTGQAPMFPLWTFGYWQSKERYKSQDELVGVVKKYRDLNVPLDGIIQDWQYWGGNYLWNAMDFLNADYANPQKMVNDVHGLNAHMIISIWASFGPQTLPYKEMKAKNMLLDFNTWPESGSDKWPPNMDYPSGVRPYDAYNPEARNIYWKYMNKGLFFVGIDGWWMDSTEPDHLRFKPSDLDLKTYLGSFRKVRNAFPLMTVGGVYDHQRAATADKRVFILTRSAFAGQQRYGAITWSGDITSSWETLQRQIPTGLNFSLSGIPYWNSDIGGFFLTNFRKKLADPNYRELYTRWIEFGTFCPMMRSHGADAPREIYQFGSKGDRIYDAIEKYINLRYSLLPYIYSTSWEVTAHQSSTMRALVMDFSNDKNTWSSNDEYMFGKSLLASPVTSPMYTKPSGAISGRDTVKVEDFSVVKAKQIYLPSGTDWYDFWTGEKFSGGQKITKQTPLDIIPIYVKAGSILPFGPRVQYAVEKKWDNLEIRVYSGADGDFTLYEDENDSYNYEKGKYSEIKFHWDNKKHVLRILNRSGSFPGMLASRRFNITLVQPGIQKTANPASVQSISYTGKGTTIKL